MISSMNRYSLAIALLLLIQSCHQAEKEPKPVAPLNNDSLQEQLTTDAAEDSDLTKRNINLSQAAWTFFKKKYKVITNIKEDNRVVGSFTGDGTRQTLYLVPPAEDTGKNKFQDCIGGCNSYIVSTDTGMAVLKVNDNLGGEMKNIGDMDGDGADEIMVYPSWWQSNWNAYMIYSYDKHLHKWRFFIEPVTIFANELEKKIAFVKKSSKKGFVSAYTSSMEDVDVKSVYKDFKIIK